MDIALKYKIVESIVQSNDDVVLNQISSILGMQKNDHKNELPEEVKQLINKAKNELDNNNGIPHERVMAGVRERFLKH